MGVSDKVSVNYCAWKVEQDRAWSFSYGTEVTGCAWRSQHSFTGTGRALIFKRKHIQGNVIVLLEIGRHKCQKQ